MGFPFIFIPLFKNFLTPALESSIKATFLPKAQDYLVINQAVVESCSSSIFPAAANTTFLMQTSIWHRGT